MIAVEKLLEKISALPPRRIDEVIDFVNFLSDKESASRRSERADNISAFADEFGGTEVDFDAALEQAGVEHLLAMVEDEK